MPASDSSNPKKTGKLAVRGAQSQKERPYFDSFPSPIGELYMVFYGNSLAGVSFLKPHIKAGAAPESFIRELKEYFGGKLRAFRQEVVFIEGTEFEKNVWLLLKEVPYGETRTYKWLAERLGKPNASRAVGQALAKNPLPIVLPCHRIIESDGAIGGYAPGIDIKRRLLALEYYRLQA